MNIWYHLSNSHQLYFFNTTNRYSIKLITGLLLVLSLSACSGGSGNDDTTPTSTTEPDQENSTIETGTIPLFELSTSKYLAHLVIPASISLDENLDTDNLKIITNLLYENLNDDFDFIFLVSNNENTPSNISYAGRNVVIKNSVEGIGRSIYDNTSAYGSASKLKSVVHFPRRNGIQNGPALHEIAHNWGNALISTGNGGHWNYTGFDDAKGQLGGYDAAAGNNLQVESGSLAGGGTFSAPSFGTFANGGNSLPYNEVELYMMGLISKPGTNLYLAENPQPTSGPTSGRRYFTANALTITPFDTYLSNQGIPDRNPATASAQKSFRVLTVLISHDKPLDSEIETVDNTIQWFSFTGDDGLANSYNFNEATGFRATMSADNLDASLK